MCQHWRPYFRTLSILRVVTGTAHIWHELKSQARKRHSSLCTPGLWGVPLCKSTYNCTHPWRGKKASSFTQICLKCSCFCDEESKGKGNIEQLNDVSFCYSILLFPHLTYTLYTHLPRACTCYMYMLKCGTLGFINEVLKQVLLLMWSVYIYCGHIFTCCKYKMETNWTSCKGVLCYSSNNSLGKILWFSAFSLKIDPTTWN